VLRAKYILDKVLWAKEATKRERIMKIILWIALGAFLIVVGGLLIYSDYYGNVKMQEAMLEVFKMGGGAFVGAWANELTK
jgi:hypothetical protein